MWNSVGTHLFYLFRVLTISYCPRFRFDWHKNGAWIVHRFPFNALANSFSTLFQITCVHFAVICKGSAPPFGMFFSLFLLLISVENNWNCSTQLKKLNKYIPIIDRTCSTSNFKKMVISNMAHERMIENFKYIHRFDFSNTESRLYTVNKFIQPLMLKVNCYFATFFSYLSISYRISSSIEWQKKEKYEIKLSAKSIKSSYVHLFFFIARKSLCCCSHLSSFVLASMRLENGMKCVQLGNSIQSSLDWIQFHTASNASIMCKRCSNHFKGWTSKK